MGYSVGKVDGRWVGYGVPAECDWPTCRKVIHRGYDYKCEEHVYYEWLEDEEEEIETIEDGCGLFFCWDHKGMVFIQGLGHEGLIRKPDSREWITHVLLDDSWAKWRTENPDEVLHMQQSRVTG